MQSSVSLDDLQTAVRADIAAYVEQLRTGTEQQYGAAVAAEIECFLRKLLAQASTPGVFVIIGYEMEGGRDRAMILRAARAVAMFRAATGMQQNANPSMQAAARAGECAAQLLLANLEVDAEINRRAVSIMNRTLLLTAHAQTVQKIDPESEQVLEWRALEHIVNPLHVGMVLAAADCHATDAITPFATELGKAQLTMGKTAAGHLQAARTALHAEAARWPEPSVRLLEQFIMEK